MKIAIATDHNGIKEKEEIINYFSENFEIIDKSPNNNPTDDYPYYAFLVAEYVRNNKDTLGVLLCGTGIGMSIAANKVKGIRCAHVSNLNEAKLARQHNSANIIALSYKNNINDIIDYIKVFITTDFSNEERHIRRIKMISEYEEGN